MGREVYRDEYIYQQRRNTFEGGIIPPYDPNYDIDGNAYAWGKTARLLTEQQFLEALNDTKGPFFAVDLCSSLPYYRQMMTGQHKQRSRQESKEVVGAFVDQALYKKPEKSALKTLKDLDPEQIRKLKRVLGQKGEQARQYLQTYICDLLFDPTERGKAITGEENISRILLDDFQNSTRLQHTFVEPSGRRGDKGNWEYITNVDSGATLAQTLGDVLSTEQLDFFLSDVADFFAKTLKDKLRLVTLVSLDNRPLSELVDEAYMCFPERFHATQFFESTQDGDRHLQADISYLPFRAKSVSFFSSIEGWPFYFGSHGLSEKLSVAKQIAQSLVPGGKGVFFPWEVKREDMDVIKNMQEQERQLREVEHLWMKMGLLISKEGFTHDQLMEKMSDRELVLTDRSPVFKKSDGIFTVLTIAKPKIPADSQQYPMQ